MSSSIPDEILQAKNDGRIPDDVSLEYLAESRDYEAIVGMLTVMVFSILIVFLRAYARHSLIHAFGLDDILALACVPFYVSTVALGVVLINLGSGRHYDYIQYVIPLDEVNTTQVLDVVARIMYITALVICRGSILAFYRRLASHHRKLRWAILGATVFIVSAFITQLFLIIFHCKPVTGLWPYDWQPEFEDYDCMNWGHIYISSAALSIASDLLLLGIPIWLIHVLQTGRKNKLLLSLILLPGVGVLALSVVRIYLIYIGTFADDFSWYYNPQLVVESAEVGGTLIALSIPGLKPIVGDWGSKLVSVMSSGSYGTRATGTVASSPKYFFKSDRTPSREDEAYELSKSAGAGSVFSDGGDHPRTPQH